MKNTWVDKFFILFLCALAPSIYFGCAANDESFGPRENPDITLESGRQLLIDHRVKDAHLFYKAEFERTPTSGTAAVGYAITRVLLLPYDPAMTSLVRRLGGTGALNAKRDVLYGTNGIISLLAQGTPIEDQGGFSGIRSLLGPDLPWDAEQLTDPDFLNKIDVEFQAITGDLVAITDIFIPIIDALEVGINDSSFQQFELPGEIFFNEHLTLSINRADLAFATAALRAIRSVTLFVAAYDHPYKVSDFGSQWRNIGPQDPLYKAGYQEEDYIIEFLDPKMFRTIQNPAHLLMAGKELKLAFQATRKALKIATDEPRFGALAWNKGDTETILKASTFLHALENAVDESTKLPFIQPSLSLDMSVIFKDGRTLDPQIPWILFEPDMVDPTFILTDLNPDAFESLFEGLFTPRLEDFEEGDFPEAEEFSELIGVLLGSLDDDFNTSFGN